MGNHKSNLLRSATVFQNVDYYLKKDIFFHPVMMTLLKTTYSLDAPYLCNMLMY